VDRRVDRKVVLMVDRKVVQRVGPMARKMFGLAGWIARSETRQSFRKNSDQGSERESRHREMRHARIAKDLLVEQGVVDECVNSSA